MSYNKIIIALALLFVVTNAADVRTNLRGSKNATTTTDSNSTTGETIISMPTGKPYMVISDNYGVMDKIKENAKKSKENNNTALENLKRLMDNEKKAGCIGCTGKLPEDAGKEEKVEKPTEDKKEEAGEKVEEEKEVETRSINCW
tara:strand:+ start:5843 stop:6277 length:435 start_codon:yes stop_codon:yes gene_type:complete